MSTKLLLTLLLASTLSLNAEMKCEAGKCSSGKCETGKCEMGKCGLAMTKDIPKNIPKKDTMPCGAGKCGTSMSKDLPNKEAKQDTKETSATAMKCQAGKCGSGMSKSVPKRETTKQIKQNEAKPTPTIEQLFNVTTVEVKHATSAIKQVNYGYIVAPDYAKVEVTSWFSGYVKELYVDTLYQKVKKGQPLVLVYSPEVYKAKQDYLNAIRFHAKRKSTAMVQSAKIKLVLLGVSQQEISEVKNQSKISRYTTIYAPHDGWIFEKNVKTGAYLNNKKSLYTIVDLSTVWLEAKLFQNELSTLDKMKKFNVKIKGIKKNYRAKKELLYPMIDPKETTATLRLSLDNKDGVLKPGMYASLYSSMKKEAKILVPRTAVIRKSGIWYAFLATEFKGEYEPVKIKVQPLDNTHYEVLSGLQAGDKVVNNALFMMDSDAQINSIY